MLEGLRKAVFQSNIELQINNLVAWTSGNVSGRDLETGLIVIKPSGIKYNDLSPENMVVVDIDGNVIEGSFKPSSDTASHCYIYGHRSDIFGVVHTHSNYATAFAAVGKPIPIYLTTHADEFGCEIPCAGFALIGGEEIGNLVISNIGQSKAILLKNHGVFTIGTSVEDALKSAVMVENIAKSVWLAMQIGNPTLIPEDSIKYLHDRYMNVYGQKKDTTK